MDEPQERASVVSAFRAVATEGGPDVRYLRGPVIVAAPDFQDGDRVTLADLESVVHYDGAFMTAEESVRLAHRYMEKRPSFDLEHDGRARAAAAIESSVLRTADGELTPGSFMLAAKSYDAELNALIDTGELRAWSVQFMVSVQPVTVILSQPGMEDVPLMLMRFTNGDPQFVSFVKFPAIGVDWTDVERSNPVMLKASDLEWDEDAARARVAEWATVPTAYGPGLHLGRYARAFASVGRSGFNSQFADVVDGQLVAVPRAIRQIAGGEFDRASEPVARIGRLLGLTSTERSMAKWEGFLNGLGIATTKRSASAPAEAPAAPAEGASLAAAAEAAAEASAQVADASLAADLDGAAAAIEVAAAAVDAGEAALSAPAADGEAQEQALSGEGDALDVSSAAAAAERAKVVLEEVLAAAAAPASDAKLDALRALMPGLSDDAVAEVAARSELADDGSLVIRAPAPKVTWVDRAMTFDEAFSGMAASWTFDAGLQAASWALDDVMWSVLWDSYMDRDGKLNAMRSAVADFAAAMNGVIDRYDGMTREQVKALAASMSGRGAAVTERAILEDEVAAEASRVAAAQTAEIEDLRSKLEAAEVATATAQSEARATAHKVAVLAKEKEALMRAVPAPAAPSGSGPETNRSEASRAAEWGPVVGI